MLRERASGKDAMRAWKSQYKQLKVLMDHVDGLEGFMKTIFNVSVCVGVGVCVGRASESLLQLTVECELQIIFRRKLTLSRLIYLGSLSVCRLDIEFGARQRVRVGVEGWSRSLVELC